MTKSDLKNLIKEVLSEAQKLSPQEAADPRNIAAKQIGAALKANPLYKNVSVTYFTNDSEGPVCDASAELNIPGGGDIYFYTYDVSNKKIKVSIDLGETGYEGHDTATRIFTRVDDAINFSKNPLKVFKSSNTHELKGAKVLTVVDKGTQAGMIITLLTNNGEKITGNFRPQ